MRDISVVVLSDRFPEVVDGGAEIGARCKRLLEAGEESTGVAAGCDRLVPLAEALDERGLVGRLAFDQLLVLLPESGSVLGAEPRALRGLEPFLELQHLF